MHTRFVLRMLADLSIQKLSRDLHGNATADQVAVQMTGVYHNLLRQWAEM